MRINLKSQQNIKSFIKLLLLFCLGFLSVLFADNVSSKTSVVPAEIKALEGGQWKGDCSGDGIFEAPQRKGDYPRSITGCYNPEERFRCRGIHAGLKHKACMNDKDKPLINIPNDDILMLAPDWNWIIAANDHPDDYSDCDRS